MTVRRTSISAHEVQVGDVLDTFQQGRIKVEAIEVDGPYNVKITTTAGRTWRASRIQMVMRIEVR